MNLIENYLIEIQSDVFIFPKEEHKDIIKKLNNNEVVSTTRNSCGNNKKVFKVGQKYKTQWGGEIKISKVQHFDDPKKIPTWNKMNKPMQKSILYGIKMCGTDNLQWIHLRNV